MHAVTSIETRNQQHRAIAFLVAAVRPDWATPGIMAALDQVRDKPLADVAVAAIRAAGRTDQRTPAVIAMAGEHWAAVKRSEPTPAPPSLRSEAICQGCNRDRTGHDAVNALDPSSAHEWLTLAEVEARPVRRLA